MIDSAITLFGKAFPAVAPKHRVQLLTHFRECIKQAKSSRQQAIQINIFTAFLAALKVRVLLAVAICVADDLYPSHCTLKFLQNLVETKSVLGSQELLTNAYGLIAVSTYMYMSCYMLSYTHVHVHIFKKIGIYMFSVYYCI